MKYLKRILILSTLVIALGLGWTLVVFDTKPLSKECAFCTQSVIQTHRFYQDDLVLGLCTYKPIKPGHCLIIPKRHVQQFDQLTSEEITAIGKLTKKVNLALQKILGPSSYLILQKNGSEVYQSVPHVHFHYIPRPHTDSSPRFSLVWGFITEFLKKPIPEEKIAVWVNRIKETMADIGDDEIENIVPLEQASLTC